MNKQVTELRFLSDRFLKWVKIHLCCPPMIWATSPSLHHPQSCGAIRLSPIVPYVLIIFLFLLNGCDRKTNIQPPCPPLPVTDGHVTIKTRGGITLRLPADARLIRGSDKLEKGDCQILVGFYSDWLWYQGKLVPEHDNRFKVDKRVYVMLYNISEGLVSDVPKEPWRYQPVLPHKSYPLDYYPHSHWPSPKGAEYDYENNGYWGIRGKKSLLTNDPVAAWCAISPADPANPNSITEGKASGFNLFACRGGMAIPRKEKYIAFSIDVAAEGVPEIDRIYDAIEQKLQTFVARRSG